MNDADTGLVYMQQRYYDPIAARFLSVDPIVTDANDGQHFSRYEYAHNNPYRYTDPDGAAPPAKLLQEGGGRVGSPESIGSRGMDGTPARQSIEASRATLQQMRAAESAKSPEGAKPAEAAKRSEPKETGSYTNTHESGKTYDGKGSRERSQESGRRVEAETGDKHTSTDWTPAKNARDAFKQEAQRLDSNGGSKSDSNYNKIESPGKKMLQEDAKKQ